MSEKTKVSPKELADIYNMELIEEEKVKEVKDEKQEKINEFYEHTMKVDKEVEKQVRKDIQDIWEVEL